MSQHHQEIENAEGLQLLSVNAARDYVASAIAVFPNDRNTWSDDQLRAFTELDNARIALRYAQNELIAIQKRGRA